jgi:hypothetical protein
MIGLGLIGIIFGVAGAWIGGSIPGDDSIGFASLGLAIGGLVVGYPAGIILGIVLIRKVLRQPGSLLLGILGSIAGAAITLVLAEPLNLNSSSNLLFGTFLVAVPVFSTVGYYLRR